MKRIVTILTILFSGISYSATAQPANDNNTINLPETPIQSTPVIGTESNSTADSGIVMNEEFTDAFYGVAPNKLITTNVITQKLVAYPNPATDYVNVILPDITTQRVHAYLHDLQGGMMQAFVFAPGGNQISFDLTSLPQGMYNLRVYEEGQGMYIMRIVKDR
jgi:hypothetical protein